MLVTERAIEATVLICALFNWASAVQSSEFFVKSERQSETPRGSEKSEFDYYQRLPRGNLYGPEAASARYARYYNAPTDHSNYYQGAPSREPDPFGSGYYGLAFVAPSTYGYSLQGAYDHNPTPNQYYNTQSLATTILGPGRYAFPIFDYGRSWGGFGGLGYLGQNLGFGYPGYGLGNKMFSEGVYPMSHI